MLLKAAPFENEIFAARGELTASTFIPMEFPFRLSVAALLNGEA
jgi:hypothetical protein